MAAGFRSCEDIRWMQGESDAGTGMGQLRLYNRKTLFYTGEQNYTGCQKQDEKKHWMLSPTQSERYVERRYMLRQLVLCLRYLL
jgi:hypothetical protein